MKHVVIKDQKYPARVTMGALLRFKRETGKDISELKDDVTDVLVFVYCCVQSACKADGVDFTMTLEEFCDNMPLEDISNVFGDILDSGAEVKKKENE